MGEERAHALLSASAAKRWIACPPSARLEESFPESESDYAKEGSLAHEICELKLRKQFIDSGMTQKKFTSALNKLKKNKLYQEEMERFTDVYADYVSKIAYGYPTTPYIAVEQKVDYSSFAPEGFGTADCIILHGNTCHVIDFKYGKGVPVSANYNRQMQLYALGALAAYGFIYPIQTFKLTVVQPRLDSISEWEITKDELLLWGESIKPIAELAFRGEGEFMQGGHCQFCRAAATCRKRMEENMALEPEGIDPITGKLKLPPLISDEEVGRILARAQNLAAWVKKLEAYALDSLVKGSPIPGWKIVEGRSNRTFSDQDAAFDAVMGAGYEEALLYDQKPISLTALEKLLGRELFDRVAGPYIVKPQGAPTLAPEGDNRPAMALQTSAAEDFKEV